MPERSFFAGGRAAERYGFKRIYALSLASTGLLTLLTPLVAGWGFYPFCVLRALMGVCEGATFPSLYVLAKKWVPPLKGRRICQFVRQV